ncbi:MAG: PglZ domain-containing protein, partial [bacterium]
RGGMMGFIADYLKDLITQQVERWGVLVWYDQEKIYGPLVQSLSLSLSDCRVEIYEDSFFDLRYRIEPFLEAMEGPPRLLLYIPKVRGDCYNALAEAEAAGKVMEPSAPRPLNSRFAEVAWRVAKEQGKWSEEEADRLVQEIKQQRYRTLEEVERVIAHHSSALLLVFDTEEPIEVALRFLRDPQRDEALLERQIVADLGQLLATRFGIPAAEEEKPAELRRRFIRYLLISEVAGSLTEIPQTLSGVPLASPGIHREACRALAQRLRQEGETEYAALATVVEAELHLESLDLSMEALAALETFPGLERRLLDEVERVMAGSIDEALLQIAHARQTSFWAGRDLEIFEHWRLLEAVGRVRFQARRVGLALESPLDAAEAYLKAYTEGSSPWCRLDQAHRALETLACSFYFNPDGTHDSLSRLIQKAREEALRVDSLLAQAFLRQWQREGFPQLLLPQKEVFFQRVQPFLSQGKRVAFFAVDALRYELARELADSLEKGYDVKLEPAMAMIPTVTEVGMAALLPGNAKEVVLLGEDKLGVKIDGTVIANRPARLGFLQTNFPACLILKLEELSNLSRGVREKLSSTPFVMVTSQEIDSTAEGQSSQMARSIMELVPRQLERAFRLLADLGFEAIVVSADHGFLLGDAATSENRVEPPGGQTLILKRRFWLGRGGIASEELLRLPFHLWSPGSELELATPWSLGFFKGMVNRAYVHGGLSPQELVTPVLTLLPKLRQAKFEKKSWIWKLEPKSAKISNRVLRVVVAAKSQGLFPLPPPRVRLEVMAGKRVIGSVQTATYGYEDAAKVVQMLAESGSETLTTNTFTLVIDQESSEKKAILRLLDAESGVELSHKEMDLDIAI